MLFAALHAFSFYASAKKVQNQWYESYKKGRNFALTNN